MQKPNQENITRYEAYGQEEGSDRNRRVQHLCTECGSELQESWHFCQNCGTLVHRADENQEVSTRKEITAVLNQEDQAMIPAPATPEVPLGHSDRIMYAAKPRIYEANSFRMLGMTGTATLTETQKKAKKLNMMRKVGMEMQDDSIVPLPSAQGIEAQDYNDAIHRLLNPHDRLMEELFWYHLEPAETD